MKIAIIGYLAVSFGLAGCMDGSPDLGGAEQASFEYDDCATSASANASEFSSNGGDSYTRSASTINQTCDCKNWQTDKNAHGEAHADAVYPDCRPTTIVDLSLAAYHRRVSVLVPGWTSLVNGQTECLNSMLEAKLQKRNWTTSQYENIATSGALHPTWSDGVCGSVFWPHVLWLPDGSSDYRVRARATRGLDKFSHGYETVVIRAEPWS